MSDEDLPELPAHLDPRQPPPRRSGKRADKTPESAAGESAGTTADDTTSNDTTSNDTTPARSRNTEFDTREISAVPAVPPEPSAGRHAAKAANAANAAKAADPATRPAAPTPRADALRPVTRRQRRRTEHPVRVATLRAARGVAALLALCLLLGSGLAYSYFNRLTSQAGTAADLDDIEGNVAAEPEDAGKAMDILVIGTDGRDGTDIPDEEDGGGLHNTDTMMLIHVPADGTKASVVSFPRDSYVTLPDGSQGKMNSAYAIGYNSAGQNATEQQRKDAGQTSLIQTVSSMSGVQIDHFVEITLAGFKDLTAAVGGIDVNLCEATQDSFSGADFPAGPQHLDENQALAFVRQRHGLTSDLDRIKRQQYFMGAMIRTVLGQQLLDLFNLDKLTTLIDALAGTINYDPALDPLELADQMRDIAAGNVEFRTIPVLADDHVDGVGDVLVVADDEEMKAFFAALNHSADAASSSASSETSAAVDPSSFTVDVYDGAGTAGLIDQASSALTTAGFQVGNVAAASTMGYAASEVHYATGMEAEANAVAAAVPGATLVADENISDGAIMVIVGQNYGQTSTPEPPDAPDSTAADTNCIY